MNSCEVEPLGLVILFADQHLLSGGKISCAQCAEIDAVRYHLALLIPFRSNKQHDPGSDKHRRVGALLPTPEPAARSRHKSLALPPRAFPVDTESMSPD